MQITQIFSLSRGHTLCAESVKTSRAVAVTRPCLRRLVRDVAGHDESLVRVFLLARVVPLGYAYDMLQSGNQSARVGGNTFS